MSDQNNPIKHSWMPRQGGNPVEAWVEQLQEGMYSLHVGDEEFMLIRGTRSTRTMTNIEDRDDTRRTVLASFVGKFDAASLESLIVELQNLAFPVAQAE